MAAVKTAFPRWGSLKVLFYPYIRQADHGVLAEAVGGGNGPQSQVTAAVKES